MASTLANGLELPKYPILSQPFTPKLLYLLVHNNPTLHCKSLV